MHERALALALLRRYSSATAACDRAVRYLAPRGPRAISVLHACRPVPHLDAISITLMPFPSWLGSTKGEGACHLGAALAPTRLGQSRLNITSSLPLTHVSAPTYLASPPFPCPAVQYSSKAREGMDGAKEDAKGAWEGAKAKAQGAAAEAKQVGAEGGAPREARKGRGGRPRPRIQEGRNTIGAIPRLPVL